MGQKTKTPVVEKCLERRLDVRRFIRLFYRRTIAFSIRAISSDAPGKVEYTIRATRHMRKFGIYRAVYPRRYYLRRT